ncbi:PASTA domain containing protein [Frankia canadensis]|uniref:PASTA domain containing protein n=1 Tax=Frankia canadensis TaxID=1836972 RepID=A0A2I2KUF8_9ACTN|nr:PASTA domain-containing protein [Frankia canadensis]SNQ49307.1 PASTA domain containing protein [Frankia canadensis]SOU56597.1 PASTA domain containing protein [Frankia canadensis]
MRGSGDGSWQEARRAFERLEAARSRQDAEAALTALSDVGLLRRLLDQAELDAVRAARRGRRSWTEIAVRLGVTRQSAWERWRDLDELESGGKAAAASDAEAAASLEPAGLDLLPADIVGRAAKMLRRRSSVVVPDVVGMSWEAAVARLVEVGLVGVQPDAADLPPDIVPPRGVVTDQSPESGARVPAGSMVTLWLNRGGGSAGVREPRRPGPSPRSARAMRPEPAPTDEAVG